MSSHCFDRVRGLFLAASLLAPVAAPAQGPGVPIEEQMFPKKSPAWLAAAEALKREGKLLDKAAVVAGLAKPEPAQLVLPPASRAPLPAHEVAQRARAALVRIGWYHLCPSCSHWHLQLAGGYAIAEGGVIATCRHCVEPKGVAMREGYLVALDAQGNLSPVTAILAADANLDTAIVRAPGLSLTALPLNDQSAPGDAAYLLSDPEGFAGYFSAGLVNRYYWLDPRGAKDPRTVEGARNLRLNVSADWAPGSSGAAILDACGNAIGHVAKISSLSDGRAGGRDPSGAAEGDDKRAARRTGVPATLMVLHEAIPARAVKLLSAPLAAPVSP